MTVAALMVCPVHGQTKAAPCDAGQYSTRMVMPHNAKIAFPDIMPSSLDAAASKIMTLSRAVHVSAPSRPALLQAHFAGSAGVKPLPAVRTALQTLSS